MVNALECDLRERALALAEEKRAHNDDAFAALVRRQAPFVFRVAHAVLRNRHDAEDVVQETFLKLFRLGKLADIRDERAFLARMAWRVAVSRSTKGRNATGGLCNSNVENPEEAALRADWTATVHRLIDSLPDDLRVPLALSAMEELTSEQIAQILEIPAGTVRRRIAEARRLLKEKLRALQAKVGEYAK